MKKIIFFIIFCLVCYLVFADNKYSITNLLPGKLGTANDYDSFIQTMNETESTIESLGYKESNYSMDVYLLQNKNSDFLFQCYVKLSDISEIRRFFVPYDGFWLPRVESTTLLVYFHNLRGWFYRQFSEEDQEYQKKLKSIGVYFLFEVETPYGEMTFSGYVSNGYNFMVGTNIKLFNTISVKSKTYSGECSIKDETYFYDAPSYNQIKKSWNTSYLAHFVAGSYKAICDFPCIPGLEDYYEIMKFEYTQTIIKQEIFDSVKENKFQDTIELLRENTIQYKLNNYVLYDSNGNNLLFYFITGKANEEDFKTLLDYIKVPEDFSPMQELLELPENITYKNILINSGINVNYAD